MSLESPGLNKFEMSSGAEGDISYVEKPIIADPFESKRQHFKDNLVLGPIDKYVKYNIFPWKFIVHIILMFLTAWQVLLQIHP